MLKIKLIKIFTEDTHCGDDYYNTISSNLVNFTDWTEIDYEDIDILRKFVDDTNNFNREEANGNCYDHLSLVYYNEPYDPKILLAELIQKEKDRIAKIKKDEADKKAAKLKHLSETADERNRKKKERLEKKLKKLEAEREELNKKLV